MAMPSDKSSSLVRSSRIPHARSSKIVNPMRRSFGGNPFTKPSIIANPRSFYPHTPTNSPSGLPCRKSAESREKSGFFPDLDNKGNEKDQILKPEKVQSPATSKGTKNFMSPTISSSSKIIDSPRKSILIERNEPGLPCRKSVGSREKSGFFPNLDNKGNENDQILKPEKVRSPAASKGTKNFMSSTISSSSKIIDSPRKSILIKRNEPAQTSISLTDLKSLLGFPRRKSVESKEKSRFILDLDNKGNKKGLKLEKVRSPAASKGTKNFMSPTISSSSKFASSPRKSVLIKRNKPSQTSISLTDPESVYPKLTFTEPFEQSGIKLRVGLEEKKLEEASLTKVPKDKKKEKAFLVYEGLKGEEAIIEEINIMPNFNPNNETEFSFKTVNQEYDCVNIDPTFKLTSLPLVSATSTVFSPVGVVDPSLPPYDPVTNYLSPRPQFLYYKPNPRVELYKNRGGINLEDSLISGSFSDTQVTEEEIQSESSDGEIEDVSSDEAFKEEDSDVYETSPTRILVSNEAIEAKEMHKPHFFMRSKAIAQLLLLLLLVYHSQS